MQLFTYRFDTIAECAAFRQGIEVANDSALTVRPGNRQYFGGGYAVDVEDHDAQPEEEDDDEV